MLMFCFVMSLLLSTCVCVIKSIWENDLYRRRIVLTEGLKEGSSGISQPSQAAGKKIPGEQMELLEDIPLS